MLKNSKVSHVVVNERCFIVARAKSGLFVFFQQVEVGTTFTIVLCSWATHADEVVE